MSGSAQRCGWQFGLRNQESRACPNVVQYLLFISKREEIYVLFGQTDKAHTQRDEITYIIENQQLGDKY